MGHHHEALARLSENYGPAGLRALRRRRTPTEADLAAVGGMTRDDAQRNLAEWRPVLRRIIAKAARRDRRERRVTAPCTTVRRHRERDADHREAQVIQPRCTVRSALGGNAAVRHDRLLVGLRRAFGGFVVRHARAIPGRKSVANRSQAGI